MNTVLESAGFEELFQELDLERRGDDVLPILALELRYRPLSALGDASLISLLLTLLGAPARLFRSLTIRLTTPAQSEQIHDATVPIQSRAELAYSQAQKHFKLIQWTAGGFALIVGLVAVSFLIGALVLFLLGEDEIGVVSAIVGGSTFVTEVAIRPWQGWLDAVRQTSELSVAFDGYLEEKEACGQDVECLRAAVLGYLRNARATS